MPVRPAFEAVLDQKIVESIDWTSMSFRPTRVAAVPDPSMHAALWVGVMANPVGFRVFSALAATPTQPPPSRPAGAADVETAPAHTTVRQERPAHDAPTARQGTSVRTDDVLSIGNMQQRLALAEFADAGLRPDARTVSLSALKDAYRRLAREHHPDRHTAASEHARARHAARFARIASAYALLMASRSAAA